MKLTMTNIRETIEAKLIAIGAKDYVRVHVSYRHNEYTITLTLERLNRTIIITEDSRIVTSVVAVNNPTTSVAAHAYPDREVLHELIRVFNLRMLDVVLLEDFGIETSKTRAFNISVATTGWISFRAGMMLISVLNNGVVKKVQLDIYPQSPESLPADILKQLTYIFKQLDSRGYSATRDSDAEIYDWMIWEAMI